GRTLEPVADPSLTQTLTAVAETKDGVVLAGAFGTLLRAGGAAVAPAAPGPRARLSSVAVCGGRVFAVGVDGTVLAGRAGEPLAPVASGVRGELTAVACDGADVLAAGAGGVLLRGAASGDRLLPGPSGSDRLLTGLAAGGGHVLAVADDGT